MVITMGIVLGLMLGSFLSVLLERLGRKEGIIAGRSECPHCHHQLAWYDLIPVLSYAVMGGRCRYCRASISPMYPALELTMAAVFGVYLFQYNVSTLWQVVDLVILFGLVALFFFDLRYQVLPDVLTYSMIGIVVLRLVTQRSDLLMNTIPAAVFIASFFGILYVVSRGRWLGFGDVKLAVLIGLLFGYPSSIGVTLLAVWAGALVGVGMMVMRRANMKTALPFGSFWTAAAVVAVLWPGPVAFISGLVIPAFR